MLVESVLDSKPLPDYSKSDEYEVFLRLRGELQDERFVKFLAHLPPGQTTAFTSHHYLVLDLAGASMFQAFIARNLPTFARWTWFSPRGVAGGHAIF